MPGGSDFICCLVYCEAINDNDKRVREIEKEIGRSFTVYLSCDGGRLSVCNEHTLSLCLISALARSCERASASTHAAVAYILYASHTVQN